MSTAKYLFSSDKEYLDQNVILNALVKESIKPLQVHLKDFMYWSDVKFEDIECRSRDGFIPYSNNCGGYSFHSVIPYCEHGDDSVLDDDCYVDGELQDDFDCDGHYDKGLFIQFKYEGLDEKNNHVFYMNISYGNGDAPYFRNKYIPTIFEREIRDKTIFGIKKKLNTVVKAMIKTLKSEGI